MLTYPHINPIAVSIGPIFGIGPLQVHWYGIMYLIGFVAAWWLARYRARRPGSTWAALEIDDLIFYCAIGVIVGGRLGWCIFYGHDVIAENWLNVFHIWDGGMSFHGGMTGVLVAGIVFARVKHKRVADVLDFVAPLPGIGLYFGPAREFHQRRAVGQADEAALGVRRAGCAGCDDRAASLAALRGDARRPGAVSRPLVVHEQAAAAIGAHRVCSCVCMDARASRWNGCGCRTPTSATSWAIG